MRTLPIMQCKMCKRFLEIEREDVKVDHRRKRIFCHVCRAQSNVSESLYAELFPEPAPEPEAPSPPPPAPKPAVEEKPPEESVTAFITFLAHDENYTSAAEALGVVPQTVKNRIARLSDEQKQTLRAEGTVPAAKEVE